jgi:hypothetical protein
MSCWTEAEPANSFQRSCECRPFSRREAGGRLYFSHILFSDVAVLMGLAVVPPHRTNAALADPREYFGPPRTYRRFGIEWFRSCMRTSVCFCHLALSIRERDQSKDKECMIQYSGRLAIRPSSCSKFPFCSLSLGAAEGLNRHVTLLDASQSCAPFECAFCVTCFFCILWLFVNYGWSSNPSLAWGWRRRQWLVAGVGTCKFDHLNRVEYPEISRGKWENLSHLQGTS